MELERNLPALRQQGLGLAAISYDSVAALKNFADRRQITFPLLSDPNSELIRAFGILNETVPKGNPVYGIPYPGTYLVDATGHVQAKFFEDDYKERTPATEILRRQFGLASETAHSETTTKHLRMDAAASTAVVRPSQRVSLTLDLELPPKMHVYAPGVQGYFAIDFKLPQTDAVAKVYPAQYPPAASLHLPAIGETVPVYQGKLRLARDIAIGPDAKVRPLLNAAGELVIDGSLFYQACDDRVCYQPVTVPLRWVFRFAELDRERVPVELQRKP